MAPFITMLLPFILCLGDAIADVPIDYIALSAIDKQAILWSQISANPYPLDQLPTAGYGPKNMSKIMSPEYNSISFLHTGDEMPHGRFRIVHSYGSLCQVNLQIFDNSTYTGVFKSGGPGILRMSLASQSNTSFPPGLALKILIDGQPSQNFQLINGRGGQGKNKNFFARPMRNIFLGSTEPPTALEKVFLAALDLLPGDRTDRPEDLSNMPLYELSSVSTNGINATKIIAPYMVTLFPNPALGWDPTDQTDFRAHLRNVTVGSVLYTVAVKRTLDEDDNVIGQVVSTSEILATPYGDQTIFFNHAKKSWQP